MLHTSSWFYTYALAVHKYETDAIASFCPVGTAGAIKFLY